MTGELAVNTAGTSGPPVLWLHGYTMTSQIWSVLWRLLPYRCHLGVDLPGHGRSPAMRADLTLPEVADQVAGIARTYGARDIVGLSFGSISRISGAGHLPLLERPDLAASILDRFLAGQPTGVTS